MRENTKIEILQSILETVTQKYDYFIFKQNETLEKTFEKSIRDPLTKLYNRQYLFEYGNKVFQKLDRYPATIVLIFLDLDNFKHVNDEYGHKMGDIVLKKTGKIFQETFRAYDIAVRYGGDEFIILLEEQKYDKDKLDSMLNSLSKRIEEKLRKCKVSVSYGVAIAPDEAKSLQDLIELADERMYAQKRRKKKKR